MAISQEQRLCGLKNLGHIRRKHFSTHSDAADWWDKLTPDWRGVVLHATAINSGSGAFKAHLSKCCWRELFERLDYREMIQLRQGISRARLTFDGFGSLRDSDFSRRTADRPIKEARPIYSRNGVSMVAAPEMVKRMLEQQEGK